MARPQSRNPDPEGDDAGGTLHQPPGTVVLDPSCCFEHPPSGSSPHSGAPEERTHGRNVSGSADILLNSERDRLERTWSATKAADDLRPIPTGEYRCRIVNGELFNAKSGTPGYKLTLEVLDGEHAGRRVWHDVWLTEAALPMAKRDLGKLGIEHLEQLERPLPEGIIVKAKVALRRDDDGTECNRVVRFDVVGIEPPDPEPFAPADAEPTARRSIDDRRLRLARRRATRRGPTP